MNEGLKKELTLLDVFCIATGAMISSGLFILPGLAFAKAGPAVILSYLIAGIFCLPTLLSMAELTTAMPKAGGDYFISCEDSVRCWEQLPVSAPGFLSA